MRVEELGQLTRAGSGAQAEVYEVEAHADLLFKRYNDPEKLRVRSLERLVRLPQIVGPEDSAYISARAALPCTTVCEGSQCVGFLMPRAPASFFGRFRSGPRLLELSYLLKERKPAWNSLPLPTEEERIAIVREYVRVVRVLHRHGVILGDISMKNLLWAKEPQAAVFLIDCDGWRFSGDLPALDVLQTPDWTDPSLGKHDGTVDSDRYKLVLACLRILSTSIYAKPGDDTELPDHVPQELANLLRSVSNTEAGGRPTATQLLAALDGRLVRSGSWI